MTGHWAAQEFLYTCEGDIVDSGNNGVIINVIGDHAGEQTNANVDGLSIYNQRGLRRISPNLGEEFTNLAAFEWVFGDLDVITREDLAQFRNLRRLTIYGNRITRLDGDLLQGLPLLDVDFGNNLINSVGTGIFDNLGLRTALFLRNPCINYAAGTPAAIQDLLFYFADQCLGSAEAVLECQFDILDWLGTIEHYSCTGSTIASGRDGRIVEVVGNHTMGLTNANVLGVSVYNQRGLTRLPRGLHDVFTSVDALEWVFGDLEVISSEDLAPFDSLRVLSVYGNRIVILEANLFGANSRIEHIDFASNSISYAAPGVLRNLDSLQVALFRRNNCIDAEAGTRESLQVLAEMIDDQCPAPFEPEPECPAACARSIDDLERRVGDLERTVQALLARQ